MRILYPKYLTVACGMGVVIPKITSGQGMNKPASHPEYSSMVAAAINDLNERRGSSRQAILKYIVAEYDISEKLASTHVKVALRRGVASGALRQMKGVGATGSFKINKSSAEAKISKISKKECQVSEKTSRKTCKISKKICKTSKKTCKTSKKTCKTSKKTCKISKKTSNISETISKEFVEELADTRKVPTHPDYSTMIAAAIDKLKGKRGSSLQAILKYIVNTYNIDEKTASTQVRLALRHGVKSGDLKQLRFFVMNKNVNGINSRG
ncbi:histone H1-delta-like [Cherax quadricarinatus]|uniref:histone H1-delta-like n=1 Tax=Cherax quadricarinatus TaxID=27406 RepID=UPI00387E76A2